MNRRIVSLLLVAVMVLTLAACKKEEETTVTTFPDNPGVALVPDDFWDETEPSQEAPAATEGNDAQSAGPEETKTPDATAEAPAETQKPTEDSNVTVTEMTQYEWYHSLSGEQQMAFMETFDNIEAFFDWYNAAKAEHQEVKPGIDIGSGNIDIGAIIGGNG